MAYYPTSTQRLKWTFDARTLAQIHEDNNRRAVESVREHHRAALEAGRWVLGVLLVWTFSSRKFKTLTQNMSNTWLSLVPLWNLERLKSTSTWANQITQCPPCRLFLKYQTTVPARFNCAHTIVNTQFVNSVSLTKLIAWIRSKLDQEKIRLIA